MVLVEILGAKFKRTIHALPTQLLLRCLRFPEKQQIFNGGFEPPQYMLILKIAISTL